MKAAKENLSFELENLAMARDALQYWFIINKVFYYYYKVIAVVNGT